MIKMVFQKHIINKINKLYLSKLYIDDFGGIILKKSKLLNCTLGISRYIFYVHGLFLHAFFKIIE